MSEFATYQQFFSAEEAEGVIALFEENNIPYKFEKSPYQVDKVIAGDTVRETYELRIPTNEFEHATSLVIANIKVNLDELDKDHYLFSFTDLELHNIIYNPDEWSKQDYAIAIELLKRRGDNWEPEELENARKQKIERLAAPEKTTGNWIIAGYIFAFLGGLIAIVWGYTLWNFTKLLPDGRRVFMYQERDRRHGKRIFLLGVIFFSIGLLLRLYSDYLMN